MNTSTGNFGQHDHPIVGTPDRRVNSSGSKERSSRGREKTEYFNNLVYSGFQYTRSPASFKKEQRFKYERNVSPGPGEYMVL